MRILQVITLCELGGAQSVVVNLSNKLSEDHEVIVAAGEGDGKMFQLLDARIKTERIPSLVRRLSPWNELKTIWAMHQLYRKYQPDVVHLHSSKAGILGRIAFPKRRVVYTVHGFDSIRIAYRKFLPIERLLQNQCAAVVGVSQYDAKMLHAEGINSNVSYVYNGIFKPKTLQENPFGFASHYEATILCIARLSPPKNHELFVAVARRLPKYAFVWIGNQKQPEFEYPENTYFMGNIPNAGAYTKFADLFFLPSNYEGLPIVIIEALSMGVPVVASAVGGISELLDGKNGYAVANQEELMAEKIEELLHLNAMTKQNVSQHAEDTYAAYFTVEKMSQAYEHIYQHMLSNIKVR